MHVLIRILVATLLALWLAMPSIGGENGENGGGGGVWILPRCEFLAGDPLANTQHGAPRATQSFGNLNQGVSLQGSSECGQIVATLIDPGSGVPVCLPVIGRNAVVSAAVLQGLRAAAVADVQIVMMDAARLGYVVHLHIDLIAGTATFTVY